MLHVGCFILLWCEMLFVFVSPFYNEVMWSLKWTCLWLDVSAALIWTLFRLFDDPPGSWMMYDLGSAHLLVIVAGFHFPVWLSNIHLAQGQVVVDCELFYHDTFSAYPVCVSVLHRYGQCQKIFGLKLWQLFDLKMRLRVQLDLEGWGWLLLFVNTALLS